MICEKNQVIGELTALRSENKDLRTKLSRLEDDYIFEMARQRAAFETEKQEMLKIIKRLIDDLAVAIANGDRWQKAAEALSKRVDELGV